MWMDMKMNGWMDDDNKTQIGEEMNKKMNQIRNAYNLNRKVRRGPIRNEENIHNKQYEQIDQEKTGCTSDCMNG